MAQSTVAGYPVSPLERAVTGFMEGWQDTQKALKDSLEYEMDKQAYEYRKGALARMPKPGGGGTDTRREDPYAVEGPPGTTGSSGRGKSGGGESSWGDYAAPIVNFFKNMNYKPEAIAGIMANGMDEGGFATNWKPGDGGTSFGHWQFHEGGELGPYKAWAAQNGITDIKDSMAQARYVHYWLEKNDPNFKYLTNANTATDRFLSRFERPAAEFNYPGARYGSLEIAKRNLGLGVTMGSGATAPLADSYPPVEAGEGKGQPPVVQGKGSGPGGMQTAEEYANMRDKQRALKNRSPLSPMRGAALGGPGSMPTGLRPAVAQSPFTTAPSTQIAALANPGTPYYGTSTGTYDRPQAPPEQESVLAQVMRRPGQYAALGLPPVNDLAYEDQYYGSGA